jgi:TolB protein
MSTGPESAGLPPTGARIPTPDWSPDGEWIVFDSDRDGTWNLYLIRPDGTDERRLTHRGAVIGETFARHPAWSKDGAASCSTAIAMARASSMS